MITLRRANDRHHSRRHKRDLWFTFYPQDRADPLGDGFGALATLNEERLPPGASVPLHPARDAEFITYVFEGALAQKDTRSCCSSVIRAGEFQRMTAGRGSRHSERNASRTDWAHVFRMALHPTESRLESSHQQKRFSSAERRGVLCVLASPDGRKGSLRIRQDALIYSAMLDPGQHLIHELSPGRRAWLHVVHGEATLGEGVLAAGDGVGFTAERAVSFTARTEGEILLFDLGERRQTSTKNERVPESVASPECRDTSGIDVWEADGGA
jgi:redox-sensitive bicupin YhaK (pirin superfamily)